MESMEDLARVMRVKELHSKALLDLPNVVGVGVGYRHRNDKRIDELCVVIAVVKKYSSRHLQENQIAHLPSVLSTPDGEIAQTDIIETGEIVPCSPPGSNITRYRPVQNNCSISRIGGTAGTGGGFCWDPESNSAVLLTCNHVVTDPADMARIPKDASILQPGAYDGGQPGTDIIGKTLRIIPITTNPDPTKAPIFSGDAAIIKVTVGHLDTLPGTIEQLIWSVGFPFLYSYVIKVGRTTGRTMGWITQIDFDNDY